MLRRTGSGIMLTLLLTSMLTLAFDIQPVKSSGTIYIRADGSIDPPTAPISSLDNVTYFLIDNINSNADGIMVERDSIAIDGKVYIVQGADSGLGINLLGRSNITIKRVEIRRFETGIRLHGFSNHNRISDNVIAENPWGILLESSSNNTISGNTVYGYGCGFGITMVEHSDNNNLTGNSFSKFDKGIFLDDSWYNVIVNNNFIGNTLQAFSGFFENFWDAGYSTGGNYWNDYAGIDTDKDGIGDTPYFIESDNIDRYPLMTTWSKLELPYKPLSPSFYETSEFLIGSVAVGVIFLESNGTIDLNTENWAETEESAVINQITQALNWWANYNPSAHVSFTIEAKYRVPIRYEPIGRSLWDHRLWITEATQYLGHQSVLDYVNDLRNRLDTNWAFVIFMVDGSNDADGMFADMVDAHAPVGGPYIIMTNRFQYASRLPSLASITAHEIAHTFFATDEYNGVREYSGFLNVSDDEYADCLMTYHVWNLCDATQEQIGWSDMDSDGILDIVDTLPEIMLDPYLSNENFSENLTFNGYVTEVPYSSCNPYIYSWPESHMTFFPIPRTHKNITINTITNVEYRIDCGPWMNVTATDGAFDEAQENFTFTTPALPEDCHIIEVCVTNSVGNRANAFLKQPYSGPHDIGIANVNTSKNIVGHGFNVSITIKVINYGQQSETFNITIKANLTIIQTQTVKLKTRNSATILFVWNTTGFAKGNYTINAYAWPVQNETDTDDNTLPDGHVFVTIPGDVDGSRRVEMIDMWLIQKHYGGIPGNSKWDPNCDVDDSGRIEMIDLWIAQKHYGEHW